MKVTKLMKGLLAAALAVTMAITPAASARAAEVTVTSGASTYTFTEMPIAAFEVTGFLSDGAVILYCVSADTQIYSQGMSISEKRYAGERGWFWRVGEDKRYNAGEAVIDFGGIWRWADDNTAYVSNFCELYQEGIPGFNSILVVATDDLNGILEAFYGNGIFAMPISLEDALSRGNASVSAQAAAEAQAAAAAQAAAEAQAALEVQAAVEAQAAAAAQAAAEAQATAQAEAQAQVTIPQQTSISQNTYTVKAGDNLTKIAQKIYGNKDAWKIIYDANSDVIKSNCIIYKGQVLIIPEI